MTALRHILMSTGLHGMFAVVAAVLLFGAQAVQEHRQTIMVHLIETTATPTAAEPLKSEPVLELHVPLLQETVSADRPPPRRTRTTPRHHRSQVSHVVAVPTFKSLDQASEKFISPSNEPAPVFLEMRPHANAAAPGATTAYEAMALQIDTTSSPSTLSSTALVPPVFRPLPAGRTEPRPVLRDIAAEKEKGTRSRPRAGENLRPDYPRTAQEAGWEGTVMLRVEVLPDGSAGTVSVKRSSGYAILDDAALRAVQQWRFKPAMDGNFPVRSVVDQPVKFDLRTS